MTERRLAALLARGTAAAAAVIVLGAMLDALVGSGPARLAFIVGAAMFAALPIVGLLMVAWDFRRTGEDRHMMLALLVIAVVAIDVAIGGLT